MQAKRDRQGKPVINGSRVKWVGNDIDFSKPPYYDAIAQGYRSVNHGDRGHIVNVNHRSGEDMVLVKFDGHTRPISLGLKGIEKV